MFKPRFGGINFSLNICRAVVVGPLTFILWLWWAFTRRSYNYLKSFSTTNQIYMYKQLIKSKCNPDVCTDRITPVMMSQDAVDSQCTVPVDHNVTASCPSEGTSSKVTDFIDNVDGRSHVKTLTSDEYITNSHERSFLSHIAASTNSLPLDKSSSSEGKLAVKDTSVKCSDQLILSEASHGKVKMASSHDNVQMTYDSVVTGESTVDPLITSPPDKHESKGTFEPFKSLYWTSVELPKIYRIKQITRSCLNDVILAGISGAIREYLVVKAGVENPPDLTLTIPVDIRGLNDSDSDLEGVGVSFVLLTSPLPTNTEGSIPRLWEIRHLMEELKASADPAVMYGVHYFLYNLLPNCVSKFIINMIYRNSSVCVSNLQGPSIDITIGSHKLNKIFYWMSPPPSVPITFNVTSYNQHLYIAISTTSLILPCARTLGKLFKKHINLLADLLSKRRVPGEARAKKRAHHVIIEAPIGSGKGVAAYVSATTGRTSPGGTIYPSTVTTSPISSRKESIVMSPTSSSSVQLSPSKSHLSPWMTGASMSELSDRLRMIQMELNSINETLDSEMLNDRETYEVRRLDLKDEFSTLMKQIRRRKSLADAGTSILINVSDDDDDYDDDDLLDGELRSARRFSLASRRSSVVSSAIAFGTAAARRVSISPSNLANALISGTSSSTAGGMTMHPRSPRPSTSPEASSPEPRSSTSFAGVTTTGQSSSSYYREESSV